MSIVDDAAKTSIETSKECIVYQCQRITEGLRLAEVCSLDEELRQELIGVVTAPLCSHIAEFQLMTNPIVLHMGKPPSQRTDREERLVPFIAYAIAYGDHEMVHDALLLYTHCAQVQAFPSHTHFTMLRSIPDSGEICAIRSPDQVSTLQKENNRTVDDLLQRLKGGLDIKDVKMSEMLAAYEKKISIMEVVISLLSRSFLFFFLQLLRAYVSQIRERELELLVSAKDQALAQSEKLRIQLRNGAGNNEADMAWIRSFVGECETLKSQHDKLEIQLEVTRKNFDEKTAMMRDELLRVRQEREDLATGICQEKELVISMKKQTEDLKKKLETASAALLDRQNEVQTLNADKTKLNELLSKTIAELSTEKKTHELDISRLTADLAIKTTVIEKLTRESNELESRCAEKEAECEEYLKELTNLRSHGQKTQADLEKMKRMREEMLKLAGGYE
uniref:FRIGIDA-like protein n=1 Tax=Heterorhabditis bacteriophora TaxID=37862 RepID=A0A1I7XT25_HETBA